MVQVCRRSRWYSSSLLGYYHACYSFEQEVQDAGATSEAGECAAAGGGVKEQTQGYGVQK
jgi:hypothetical protein